MNQCAEKIQPKETHDAMVRRLIQKGDTLTHTRCSGIIEEHLYTGKDGHWLCGVPTKDTIRLGGSVYPATDISPLNVTHINRVPVSAVDFLFKR